ncbi:phage/plasmid primase, P4 family [Helcococcus kunzii]|uniref:phage/plasmid primase, P4 family n=1 Tax=Helcococcus kunzii TaxID=40091 RepID=UPI0024AE5D4B|nr:phage/plasmid primase, P4 family [Helcococcus kunzii]
MNDQLFKGYVITDNKKSTEKIRNRTDFKTLDQVKNLPEYAGMLEDDVILIDIDDFEESEILLKIVEGENLKCRVYETTRGKHFLFKNELQKTNKIGALNAIGISIDIKLGTKNSYEVIKFDNKERDILYDTKEYQIVPNYLLPIKGAKSFLNLEEGDGRNQALFSYILALQRDGFSNTESLETLRVINDYILKEPLSKKEFESITRDEAFQKPNFFKKNTFLFAEFSEYLKNNLHIKRINGQLHLYKDGVYINGNRELEAEMLKVIPGLNRAKRNEVLSYIDIIAQDFETSDERYIAFNNCLYDIKEDKHLDFSPDYIIQNKIPWDYNPIAYHKLTDVTLEKLSCKDKDVRDLLEELIGYCFFRRNELRQTFMLVGDKKNGKSTFLAMLSNLLGMENISSLDLSELDSRFKTAELFGKLANIGDDIGEDFIPNTALFKKIATGDRINAERKGQDPFEFSPYSKLIFSANNPPRIRDKTGAVLSRLILIPFEATFSKEDKDFDPLIKKKLTTKEAMEYLIVLGINALKRVLDKKGFTISEKSIRELESYEKLNNPVIEFIEDTKIENEEVNKIYKQYTVYCAENNYTAVSKIEFSRQVSRIVGLESKQVRINGKRLRIYQTVLDVS